MSIKWEGDLTGNITQIDTKVKRGMVAAANLTAPAIEAFMKNNAPWDDQTGAARNGLGADVQSSGDKIAIVFYHSVFYGVFLEARWGGKYAILRPAMAFGAPLFANNLRKLVFS